MAAFAYQNYVDIRMIVQLFVPGAAEHSAPNYLVFARHGTGSPTRTHWPSSYIERERLELFSSCSSLRPLFTLHFVRVLLYAPHATGFMLVFSLVCASHGGHLYFLSKARNSV